jgi:hypothetical protein
MILQALTKSNQFYVKNIFKIINTCVFPLLLVSVLSSYSVNNNENSSLILTFITALLQVHLTGVLILVIADISNNSFQSTINYYIKSLYYILPLFCVSILTGLAIVFGFLAFLLPGIFILGKLIFAQYFVILRGKGVFESLELAWNLDSSRAWNIGITVFSLMLLGGVVIILFISSFINEPNNIEPVILFITSILSFILINVYLYTFLLHLFLIGENNNETS